MKPLIDSGHVRLRRCRHGWMLYFATDMYIGRSLDVYGEFSELECDLFKQITRPGQTVFDVGANLGAHTVFLAQTVGPAGRVIAFEPQRLIYQMLCANLALNALANVDARQAAVGREAGQTVVPALDYTQVNNFGGLSLGDYAKGERVEVIVLDSLSVSACHLIKVDVEGMEAEVIAGARETINRFRPALYIENDRREKSAALIEQILGLDYRLYWHLPPLFNPNNFFGNPEDVFPHIVSANMLCLPRSTPQNIQGLREITEPVDSFA